MLFCSEDIAVGVAGVPIGVWIAVRVGVGYVGVGPNVGVARMLIKC